MSSEEYEASDYEHDLDLLIVLHFVDFVIHILRELGLVRTCILKTELRTAPIMSLL